MTIQTRHWRNRFILAGWLVTGSLAIGGSACAGAPPGMDTLAGSSQFQALVGHINRYSARVNAHFVRMAAAGSPPRNPENPQPAVPAESVEDLLAALKAEVAVLEAGLPETGSPAQAHSAVHPAAATDDGTPADPVQAARARPPVPEERTPLVDESCRGHRIVPATVVANVIRILAECDLRLGRWPTEQPGFYRDYRIPAAIALPAPGGVAQLLEVVETHFGMQGRPNRATRTIDFTYVGIPHVP